MHLRSVKELLDHGTANYVFILSRLWGKFQGRKVHLHLSDHGEPPNWEFRIECTVPFEFEILPKEAQSLERFLGLPSSGLLGFGRADEVYDVELDRLFDFRSSDPQRFRVWIQDTQIKNSLRALSFHSRHIILRDRQIHFTISKPDFLTIVETVLKHLSIPANSVEQNFPYPPGKAIPKIRSSHLRILIYVLIGSVLAVCVYFLSRR